MWGIGRTGGDTLDTATASEASDGRLRDTLDVVLQDLAMALGAALAEALAALAACCMLAVCCGYSDDPGTVGRWEYRYLRPVMMDVGVYKDVGGVDGSWRSTGTE